MLQYQFQIIDHDFLQTHFFKLNNSKYSQLRLFADSKCQIVLFIYPEYSIRRQTYFYQGEIMQLMIQHDFQYIP